MTARMRIGLLASALGGGGGMGRYTRELILALGQEQAVEMTVVIAPEARGTLESIDVPNVNDIITVGGRSQIDRALWERYRLGLILEKRSVDVIHGTKHLLPRTKLPTVLTVHDVLAITWPQQYAFVKRALLPRYFRASLRAASVLLAVSEATAKRLAQVDGSFRSKTMVAQNGVSVELTSASPLLPIDKPVGRFALVVGDLSPRKNVSLLIDIWDRVASATDGLQLVAVGPDGWRSAQTRDRLEKLAERGHAMWAHRVGDQQLRWYYEHATVVLAPAIEEGFGLPVAEALALGAPVIASNDEALVEVARGGAVHIPADDPTAWIEAIVSAAGRSVPRLPQPSLPTWREHATRTVDAYRRAIGG
ncbi:MAG: glycosyltransferase family 4 protein [Actinobacteria bacterium]|nr:MAG: glycosyltransferase family 4 protein [Actinomycetota bacterium]